MKKFVVLLPSLLPLVTLAATVLTPAVSAFWVHHAQLATLVAPLAVVVAHWLPSPAASIALKN